MNQKDRWNTEVRRYKKEVLTYRHEEAITELQTFLENTKGIIISWNNALELIKLGVYHESLFSYLVIKDRHMVACTLFNIDREKVPAYTAQELIQIIPTRLFWDDKEYMLTIRYKYGHDITYEDLYQHEEIFITLGPDNLADALATMYIFLIENDIILLAESRLTKEQADKLEKAMKLMNKEPRW